MKKHLHPILRALGSRNYRIFFTAQAVSLTGLWMQRVAMGWLVYRLTDSPRALGVIDFISSIPTVLLIPLTSYLLPRMSLRSVLLVTQSLLMACAATIGLLALTDYVTYAWLLSVAFFMSLVNAFDMPVRQSIVPYLVEDKEDVSNAVALNSSLFNVARLIGPTVAGVTIHRIGEGLCFMLNSASYSAMLFAVRTMRFPHSTVAEPLPRQGSVFRNMFVGFRLLKAFPPFAHMLMLVTVSGIFGVPYLSLMPAMARTVLEGTSKTMGFLLMSVGIGALAGSLIMAARKSPVGLDRCAIWNTVAFGTSVAIFSLSRSTWMAMILLIPAGFSMVTTLISCNTFLQTLVDDENRSPLMSLYIAAIVGISSVGSLLSGQVAEFIGTSGALFTGGLACVAASLYHARKLLSYRKLIDEAFCERGYREATPDAGDGV